MNNVSAPAAVPDRHDATVITTQPALCDYVALMAQSDYIAWDTEFARGGKAYHPELCLIQCMTDKGECVIIDPIAGNLDLTVLRPVFENPDIIFIGHALRQDIEVMLHTVGCAPVTLWDTQIAAFFCGETEFRGYAYLVEQMLGVVLSKQMQYSNWNKRPLSVKQLEYAALDVCYPADIYAIQRAFVIAKGTERLVLEESASLHRDIERQYSGEAAFRKLPIRDAELFTETQIKLLSSLCTMREASAVSLNLPRKHIAPDDVLLLIAEEGNTPEVVERFADDLDSTTIEQIISLAPADAPFDFASGQYRKKPNADTVTLLQFALRACAEKAGVSPEFITSKSELKGFAAFPERQYSIDSGWRRDIFGTTARAVLAGSAGVYVKDNGGFDVRP